MRKDAAVARIAAFLQLDADEIAYLSSLERPIEKFRRGQCLREEGCEAPKLYLLQRGWVASSVRKANGNRQILRAHIPGDFLGMPSLSLVRAHDTLTALSPVEAMTIEPAALMKMFGEMPKIAAVLFLIAQEERVIAMDRLTSIGTSSATQRVAALIIELRTRLVRSGAELRRTFDAPMTQSDIGDLIGVTAIHVNRSLAALRHEGVATWSSGIISINDEDRLQRMSGMPIHEFVRKPNWLKL